MKTKRNERKPRTAQGLLDWFKKWYPTVRPGKDPQKHSFFALYADDAKEIVGALWDAVHGQPLYARTAKRMHRPPMAAPKGRIEIISVHLNVA